MDLDLDLGLDLDCLYEGGVGRSRGRYGAPGTVVIMNFFQDCDSRFGPLMARKTLPPLDLADYFDFDCIGIPDVKIGMLVGYATVSHA